MHAPNYWGRALRQDRRRARFTKRGLAECMCEVGAGHACTHPDFGGIDGVEDLIRQLETKGQWGLSGPTASRRLKEFLDACHVCLSNRGVVAGSFATAVAYYYIKQEGASHTRMLGPDQLPYDPDA